MARVDFDPVARIYALLERIVFQNALEQCRTSLLPVLPPSRHALFIGEGDGRFLQRFVERFPDASVDVVESSPAMIRLARQRISDANNVRFLQQDVLAADLPEANYDLIVTHFFLDLLSERDVIRLVEKVRRHVPQAYWLLSEFRVCRNTAASQYASLGMLRAMYSFFRITAGLKTSNLPDYTSAFIRHGLTRRAQQKFWGGFIVSELWSGENLVSDDTRDVR